MKITAMTLAMLRVPLRTPFRTALRQVDEVSDLVVMLHTDCGRTGYGSTPETPAITGHRHPEIIQAIRSKLWPILRGTDVASLESLVPAVGMASNNCNAQAAVEIALYDLRAQLAGMPLCRWLGGAARELSTGITISLDTTAKMLADAEQALQRNFASLKVKVGGEPIEDIDRITALYTAVGSRARLLLDANQGWTPDQAIELMHALEGRGVEVDLLEQPVAAADIRGLAAVTAAIDTPVMADESVFGPEDAREVVRNRAAAIINIKLAKAGGISRAMAIADLAAEAGLSCMVGCMLESPVAVSAAAHFAAARADVVSRVDLDAPELCTVNPVVGGARFCGPDVVLSEAPGLGITAIEGLQVLPLTP